MQLGVFKTREKLFSMKLTKSDKCLACSENQVETLFHLLIHCEFFRNIREEYLPRLAIVNSNLSSIITDEKKTLISIINPESSLLPSEARKHSDEVFNISRSFCYDIYRKREKFYERIET